MLRLPTVTIAIVTNTAASAISNISLLLHQGSPMFAEVAKILGISGPGGTLRVSDSGLLIPSF